MITEQNAAALFDRAAAKPARTPHRDFRGRGIVIPAGGSKYFACAWICIRMLRELDCKLPIELWCLGDDEVDSEMRDLVRPLGVKVVNARNVQRRHNARILNGWELKPYAIIHSAFSEVLLLDADNVPIVDPTFLFHEPAFQETGAVFWPDFGRLGRERRIWELTQIPYRDEPEFETGQIVVDKRRCWDALNLTMWLNEHSDFWYQYVHGDKETFHLAWRKLSNEYAMPDTPIAALPCVMCQHDFTGRRVFQHRNLAKWRIHGYNRRIPGFILEDRCLSYLRELESKWNGCPIKPYSHCATDMAHRRLAAKQCQIKWLYERVGYDQREMRFQLDGRVTTGAARCERRWRFGHKHGQSRLMIIGEDELTCVLSKRHEGWVGAWVVHERMPVRLTPLPPPARTSAAKRRQRAS
jgi:hypothetical protein